MLKLAEEYAHVLSETILTMSVKSGIITKEMADIQRKTYKYYMPFYQVKPNVQRAGYDGTMALHESDKVLYRYYGHSGPNLNIIEATERKLAETIRAVDTNRLMVAIEEGLKQKNMGIFGNITTIDEIKKYVYVKDMKRKNGRAL